MSDVNGTEVVGGDEYTEEELAYFKRDDGAEDVSDEGGVEPEVDVDEDAEEVPDDVEVDRWERLKAEGYDPDKLENTFKTFTKKLEEERAKVRAELDDVAKWKELGEEITSDPGLQEHIRAYFEKSVTPLDELNRVKSEVENLRRNLTVKDELSQLEEHVKTNGLPQVDSRELLEFAARTNAQDLMTAYKAMTYDDAMALAEERAFDKVKKSKGAAVPKVGVADTAGGTGLSDKIIANMSDKEFEERYEEIQKFYRKR